jgi:hypothetical protein
MDHHTPNHQLGSHVSEGQLFRRPSSFSRVGLSVLTASSLVFQPHGANDMLGRYPSTSRIERLHLDRPSRSGGFDSVGLEVNAYRVSLREQFLQTFAQTCVHNVRKSHSYKGWRCTALYASVFLLVVAAHDVINDQKPSSSTYKQFRLRFGNVVSVPRQEDVWAAAKTGSICFEIHSLTIKS